MNSNLAYQTETHESPVAVATETLPPYFFHDTIKEAIANGFYDEPETVETVTDDTNTDDAFFEAFFAENCV